MRTDLIHERVKKLNAYRALGNDPYPATVQRTVTAQQFVAAFKEYSANGTVAQLVGRIVALRPQGKIVFLRIEDGTGAVQVVMDEESTEEFATTVAALDVGDFVSVNGTAYVTKRGEESVLAKTVLLATKSIRPIPATWYGLEDVETRLRQRYLDLALHAETRELFIKKNIFWNTVRTVLTEAGFLAVETPVLEPIPGGAEAEPFVTHHHALDRDFFLRISLELPLKKLLVGGFEKVFEIGRIFRNEGIDREHLQDYTQMECYWAYADYNDMMRFTRTLYQNIVQAVCGSLTTTVHETVIDWSGEWKTYDYYEEFARANSGMDLATVTDNELITRMKELKIPVPAGIGRGRLIDALYKKTVRPSLIAPGFLVNPPAVIEPLAKRLPNTPERVARFQIMAAGTELGKGFSELNDPLDQRARFEEQAKLREAGDTEAQRLDEDFLTALEYGMPPAAGFGMSERLFAILMNRPVRETVIFPLMREV